MVAVLPRKLPKPSPGGVAVRRPPVLRAILLARVSTTHADQDTSPDRQLARLEALAAGRGWEVVDRIVERTSGAQILDRPPVARALERIIDGRADVLVVDHLFRLGRNVRELLEVVDILRDCGGSFYDASNSLDTTTPLGRVIFTVFGAIGEFEIADRRLKIMEGLERARARGTKLGKPSALSDAAKARALALRLEEREIGFPFSWNEIRQRLEDEKLGKFTRATISMAVTRMMRERKGAA